MAETHGFVEVNRPSVSWGAIFAGAMIAIAIQFLLMSLGAGIKLAFDPLHAFSLDQGDLLKIGIFTVASNLIAIFVGGYVAGRLGGFSLKSVSALHGLCSWALVSVFSVMVVESGLTMSQYAQDAVMDVSRHVSHGGGSVVQHIASILLPQPVQYQVEMFDAEELNSRMGWVTFFSLGLGAASSVLGGLWGGRNRLRASTPTSRLRFVA